MPVKLLRQDGTEVPLDTLFKKILAKCDEEGNEYSSETKFCLQEAHRMIMMLSQTPLVSALCTLSKDIPRVLATFFRIGFMLGRTIDNNSLTIECTEEDDASTSTDTKSNIADSNTDNGRHTDQALQS